MNALVEQAPFDSRTFSHPLPDDAPVFCPVCGRPLEYSYWDTVDGEQRYSSFLCFGGARLAWLWRWIKSTTPSHTHYRYEFGPFPVAGPPRNFDPLTGKRL